MTIKEVEQRTGLPRSVIRFYEKEGLIAPQRNEENRYRAYSQADVDFTLIDRGNTMVEMVMKGCSKAGGMMALLEHLGVDKDNTMAIGDSTNDLPMFSVAGHTVCLGGGMDELKAEAEYITDTVMNDGVEKALHHFGLL